MRADAVDLRPLRKQRLFPRAATSERVSFGRADLERMLPHRAPFLLLDGVSEVDAPARSVRGHRTILASDPVFAGHFPGDPIYPGVLLLETMGQLGICALLLLGEAQDRGGPVPVRALRVQDAWFLAEVRPGDELEIAARVVEADSYRGTCVGQVIKADGAIAAVAQMEVYFVE